MAKSDELKEERRRYCTLRDSLESTIIGDIQEAYTNLQSVSLEQAFSIDYESADNGKIADITYKVEDMKDKVNGLILPAIFDKISDLDRKIRDAEEEEAEDVAHG